MRTRSPLFLTVSSICLLLLVTCSGVPPVPPSPTVPPTATVSVSAVEDVTQAFISAYEARQPDAYLALFSDDAIFLDNSVPYRSEVVVDLVRISGPYVRNLFTRTNFGIKFQSRIIARDGRRVALTGTYSNTGKDGNLASVPVVIILEIEGGQIVREDQYYDNTAFY